MGQPPSKSLDANNTGQKWPWWEPYAFTACVGVVVGLLLIVFGFIVSIPYSEPIRLAVMTAVAVVEVARRPTRWPSALGNSSLAVTMGLASYVYLSLSNQSLAIGYAILAAIWFGLAIQASSTRAQLRNERSARLVRARDTLRAAMRDNDSPPESRQSHRSSF